MAKEVATQWLLKFRGKYLFSFCTFHPASGNVAGYTKSRCTRRYYLLKHDIRMYFYTHIHFFIILTLWIKVNLVEFFKVQFWGPLDTFRFNSKFDPSLIHNQFTIFNLCCFNNFFKGLIPKVC